MKPILDGLLWRLHGVGMTSLGGLKSKIARVRARLCNRPRMIKLPGVNDASLEGDIDDLYSVLFGRRPNPEEKGHRVSALRARLSEREVFDRFKVSTEYKQLTRARLTFPNRHYYSPTVDPDDARKYFRVNCHADPESLGGISISLDNLVAIREHLREFIVSTDFPSERTENRRFHLNNNIYPIGDATILRAMIFAMRPKRIIEIGSGLSSACMLDALDESDNSETQVTFVEPYQEQLLSLLRPSDHQRCRIIAAPVQTADVHCSKILTTTTYCLSTQLV